MTLDQLRALFQGENAAKIKHMIDELDRIDGQMAQLADKRRQLDDELKRLIGNEARPARTRQSSTGRRSGIRDNVLEAIKAKAGMSPAQIRKAVGIADGDKSGSQSVSNALSALKRAGTIKETGPRQYAVA